MKKIFTILSIAVATVLLATLAACGGKETKGADSDTVPSEEEEILEEFTSPDLGLWHLNGPVSGAVCLSFNVTDAAAEPSAGEEAILDSVTFDTRGRLSSMVTGMRMGTKTDIVSELLLGYDDEGKMTSGKYIYADMSGYRVKLSRSSGGYLQVLQVLGADGEFSMPGTFHRLIEWTNGRVMSIDTEGTEGTIRDRYGYGEDEFPASMTTTVADMGFDMKIDDSFEYTAFDKYGNWTERRVMSKTKVTEGEADGTNTKTTDSEEYRVDRRAIYYYPLGVVEKQQ